MTITAFLFWYALGWYAHYECGVKFDRRWKNKFGTIFRTWWFYIFGIIAGIMGPVGFLCLFIIDGEFYED